MSINDPTKPLTVFAPAKVNLYLHITGRLDDGYHTLDSLISFADIGDQVTITPADSFTLEIDGPYAKQFNAKERDSSPSSSNLVVRAAWALSRATKKPLNLKVTLTKNLPLAAGLGGGSSDAAALIWGLMEWWTLSTTAEFLPDLMLELGADVPVCLKCQPAHIGGIGEILNPAPMMEEIPVVIINPGKPCPTQKIFMHYNNDFKAPQAQPKDLRDFDQLIDFLSAHDNDLAGPAREQVPEIDNVLNALSAQSGCALARMSGSGASCFGIFPSETQAQLAQQAIAFENPDWWVKAAALNRPERY